MYPNSDRGTSFEVVSCILTVVSIAVYALRVYSRTFLTRSLGSDDFALIFTIMTSTAGQVGAIIQVEHGMGRHRPYITDKDYAITQLWATIAWFFVFISFFFLRASVMLFVLRLLPSYKAWQHRVIYAAFVLNFLITMLGLITYGIQCIPFAAIWQEQLKSTAKCYSKDILVIVTQVNGILSCLIDITTALIPQFLLWNVSMKPKTKRTLNIIFALGLLTAGTSIGRAASINRGAIETDDNWRLMPSRWWAMFEEKLGIIFACCPALRQFYGYYTRVGTIRPTQHRQPEGQDFVKMRGRVTWRDVFWYQNKQAVPSKSNQGSCSGRSVSKKPEKDKYPVAAALQGVNKPSNTGDQDVEAAFRGDTDQETQERVVAAEAHTSRVGKWQDKFRNIFGTTRGSDNSSSAPSSFPESTEMSDDPQNKRKTSRRNLLAKESGHTKSSSINNLDSYMYDSHKESVDKGDPDRDRIGNRYREWGLSPNGDGEADRFSKRDGASSRPSRDRDLAERLSNPVTRSAARLDK